MSKKEDQEMIKQGTPREIAGSNLAAKIMRMEVLEDAKKEYLAEYNARKKELQNDIKTAAAIVRNYVPQFENIDHETGEIT